MLEFADKQLGKKSKKSTPFTEYVLEQARQVRIDEESGQQSRRGAEELLKIVRKLDETHKKTSKTRRASDFLQPFIEGVTRYSAVVDMMVSSDPTVSALVWGGAKFVLQVRLMGAFSCLNPQLIDMQQLAVEFSQHYENLTELLETLGGHLRIFGALSEIFDWSEELCNVLMKSYQDVLLVFEVAADAYGQSGAQPLI